LKKWRKIILGLAGTIFIVFLSIVLFFILFFVHKERLIEINLPKKDYKIEIYYVDTGALGQSIIQIKKEYNILNSEIIRNIKGSTTVKSLKFINDSTLELIVGFPHEKYGDTVMVKY